jgi:hypothetical protein
MRGRPAEQSQNREGTLLRTQYDSPATVLLTHRALTLCPRHHEDDDFAGWPNDVTNAR